MPRAVDGTKRKNRRKKILEQTKGYRGRRALTLEQPKMRCTKLVNTYRDRKAQKRL